MVSVREWTRVRVRLVRRPLLAGFVLGALAVAATLVTGETLRFASRKVFALGALVFGFALLGWSGSVFVGRGVEDMQRHLETNTDWSEADSRRAMAVLGAVGFGAMVGVSVVSSLLSL